MRLNGRTNWLLFFTITVSVLTLLFGCAPRTAIRKDYDFSKINRIGILEFTSYGNEINSGNAVADEFIRQLILRGFDVIERERMESLLREQHLASGRFLDPETAKEVGKLSGVDALITGTVTRYIPEHKDTIYFRDEYGEFKSEVFLIGAEVGINARMVDVETGLVIWASSYTYESFDMEGAIRGTVTTLLNSLKKVWPRIKKS